MTAPHASVERCPANLLFLWNSVEQLPLFRPQERDGDVSSAIPLLAANAAPSRMSGCKSGARRLSARERADARLSAPWRNELCVPEPRSVLLVLSAEQAAESAIDGCREVPCQPLRPAVGGGAPADARQRSVEATERIEAWVERPIGCARIPVAPPTPSLRGRSPALRFRQPPRGFGLSPCRSNWLN
jgi:hypothetical protein